MKPSPTLEDAAKLKEYCAWILRSASETAPASCVARAYLALISAQPGVSPGVISNLVNRYIDNEETSDEIANAIMKLLRPTSPDPARATEEREGK